MDALPNHAIKDEGQTTVQLDQHKLLPITEATSELCGSP